MIAVMSSHGPIDVPVDAPVHAYANDVLGDHDATALAELIRTKQASVAELAEAAVRRAELVDPRIHAIEVDDHAAAVARGESDLPDGPFHGVPTYLKDNIDVAGLPTNHGTAAFVAVPATSDSPVTTQLRSLGLNFLGKSRLPEFGFSASTEYAGADPVRNPWNPT